MKNYRVMRAVRLQPIFLIALASLALSFSSCGGSGKKDGAQTAAAINSSETRVPAAESSQALITYLVGDVVLADQDGQIQPEIGDSVGPGTRISTGADGYVELQFAKLAVLRIDSSTDYFIESLNLEDGRSQLRAELESGSLAAKVQKLSSNDSFEVRVQGVVCAVRGTEFIVRAGKTGSITIAVAEGSVSLNPPSLSSLEQEHPDAEILNTIRSLMPLVSENQELTLQSSDMDGARSVLAAWESSAGEKPGADTSAEDTSAEDEREKLELQLRETLKSIPPVSKISESNASYLRDFVPVTPRSSELSQTDQTDQGRKDLNPTTSKENPSPPDASVPASKPPVQAQVSAEIRTSPVGITEQRPAEKSALLSQQPLPAGGRAVGALVSDRDRVVGVNVSGKIFSITPDGKVNWVFQTENSEAENTTALVEENRIYIAGNKELVILNASDGSPAARVPLMDDQADLYGRRPLIFGNNLVLPSDSKLFFLDPVSGETRGSMIIPQGSRMTPARWRSNILIADQRGSLLYIDPETKTIVHTVASNSIQPVAQSVAVSPSSIAVFSGRRGTVTAIDLEQRKLIWERALSDSTRLSVFTDPYIQGDVVYIYAGQTLFAMNIENGSEAIPPVSGLSAPPLISGDTVYLPTNSGTLKLISRIDGSMIGEVPLGETIKSKPVKSAANILLAGEKSIFVVDPENITKQ